MHPCVVVEHQEGERSYRGPPDGERGPSITQGLPSPESQLREEEFPQNMTVKISGDYGHLGEMEGT